jgi:hypothetical protein
VKVLAGRRPAFDERDQLGDLTLGLMSIRRELRLLVEEYGHPAEDVGVVSVDASDDPFLYAVLGAWALLDRVSDWVVIAGAEDGRSEPAAPDPRPTLRDLLR